MLVLGASDLDDTADALARATLEYAATAGWLAKDLNRFSRLASSYQADWEEVQMRWEQEHPGEQFQFPEDPPIAPSTTPQGKRVWPAKMNVRVRAAGLDAFGNAYKLLSMGSVHGTLAAASYGLNPRSMRNMRVSRFALADFMVLRLARQLNESLDLGWDGRLTAAENELKGVTERLGLMHGAT
jgi:hypothetical protein